MPSKPRDANQLAHRIVQQATGQLADAPTPVDKRHPGAVALSALGASKGGHARAASLTPAKRRQLAKVAAAARWGKKR